MIYYTAHCVIGHHEYYSRVKVDKRLPGCEYGQCGILYEPGCEMLVSYDFVVAEKDAEGWIKVYACPSRSTANHLSKWGKQWSISYRTLIDLLYRGKELNVNTGKERDATFDRSLPLLNVGEKICE